MVTEETTVAQLIELGIFSQADIDRAVKRKNNDQHKLDKQKRQEEVKSFVLSIMQEVPEVEYKNGDILPFFGFEGKQEDPVLENKRIDTHKEISLALSELTEEGRILRFTGNSATQTCYMVVTDETLDLEVSQELVDEANNDLEDWVNEEAEEVEESFEEAQELDEEDSEWDPLEAEANAMFDDLD